MRPVLALVMALLPVAALAQRGSPPPVPTGPPAAPGAALASPQVNAPFDLTGYWVSVVTEDWRYRMVTPTKGDYQGVPLTQDALKIADSWDPAADTAAGNQCKSYGAPAIMRVPGRLHITWQDGLTLKLEADAGTQTRLFAFDPPPPAPGAPSWQGQSVAEWQFSGARGRGRGEAPPPPPLGRAAGTPPRAPFGSLKVVTTNLKAGYLRKNGVPYSENARLTEYFDLAPMPGGEPLLVVTSIVEDPRYLAQPFVVSTQFRRQLDATGWEPTPCSATW